MSDANGRVSELTRSSDLNKSYLGNVKGLYFSTETNGSLNGGLSSEINEDFVPSERDVKNYEAIFNSLFLYSYGPTSLVKPNAYLLSALKEAIPKLHYDMILYSCGTNSFNSKDSLGRFIDDDVLIEIRDNQKPLYEELCRCLEILYIGLAIAIQNTDEHNAQNNIDNDKKILKTNYPEFFEASNDLSRGINGTEVDKLVLFRYVINIAFTIIPSKGNKGKLLDIVTRITEGHKVQYKTGWSSLFQIIYY